MAVTDDLFRHYRPGENKGRKRWTFVVRRCRVFFNGRRGIEHAVRVDAPNRDGHSVKYRITVTRQQFEDWLGPANRGSLDRTRKYLQILLGRMKPDRDFKNGLRH